MLDFAGTIIIFAVLFFVVYAFLNAMEITPLARNVLAALVGGWTGIVVATALAGELVDAGRRVIPLIGVLFAAPLIATAVAAWLSRSARAALLFAPMPLLISLSSVRVFGGLFLLLALDGRLGGPFPYSAGWGDVITALAALPVAWIAARHVMGRDWIIGTWNAFGALDLVVAVFLGVASTPGTQFQFIISEAGSTAMQHFPWAIVPTVLVPFFLITHAVIFAQLRARAAGRQPSGQVRPGVA